ncbi:hypothetical protein ACVXG9_26750 [Escherichia coli]
MSSIVQESGCVKVRSLIVTADSGEPRRSRIASFWMEGPAAAYQTWRNWFTNY